jgi:hypothetical protein
MRTLGIVMVVALAATAGRGALAEPRRAPPPSPAPLVGLTEVARVVPETGFIELATAGDGAGLLAYAVADAGGRAEVRVLELASGREVRRVDVSGLTTHPERLWFVGTGPRAAIFVAGKPVDPDGTATGVVGALFEATGKRPRKTYGPADVVTLLPHRGQPAVVVKRVAPAKRRGDTHTVQRFDVHSGKALGKARSWTVVDGHDAGLGFRVNHWRDDGTVAIGTQEGTYDRKRDLRLPDAEGRHDLLDGKRVETTPIADPIAHARRFQVLAAEGGAAAFARVADDLAGVEVWRDDRGGLVTLDQPFDRYDPQSLIWAAGDDGGVWLGLAVDPWNRPAVQRKQQDRAYFDLFRVDGGAATRVGRVLAPGKRFALGAGAGHVWLLERNVGFSRGGKALVIYRLP